MRVQIVADVTRLAGPLLEGDELLLGLTHVRVEVAELAQLLLDALLGIGVHWIIALVHFNRTQHVVLIGEFTLLNRVSPSCTALSQIRTSAKCSGKVLTGGLVINTCSPRVIASFAMSKCKSSARVSLAE